MAKKDFDEFCRIVYDRSGISLREGKESLVASRVNKRLRALGLTSYRAYLDFVKADASGDEIVQLIDVISTNVTRFFREPAAFDFFQKSLETWKGQGQKRFRVWSAASSSGEEPYTLTIVMAEALGMTGIDWQLLGTDISTKVLAYAKEAKYPEDRVKDVPVAVRQKYFDLKKAGSGNLYTVKPMLRERVMFRRLNLATPPFPMKGPLDFVFCRNVMIYFDNTVRAPLIGEIFRLLKPGGYLAVGSSESLTGLQMGLNPIQPSIYQKPL